MYILGLGCLSFLIFILYDMNQIKINLIWFRPFFTIGCLLLAAVTWTMVVTPFESDHTVNGLVRISFAGLAGVSLVLLIYTLFFAIPFYQAYVKGSRQKLCTEGVYTLSRHPGVLFLFCFYVFLGVSMGKPFIIIAGIVFSLMNLLYVYLQDRYFFPVSFEGYEDYKNNTTFVIPSLDSVKRCIQYYC